MTCASFIFYLKIEKMLFNKFFAVFAASAALIAVLTTDGFSYNVYKTLQY